MSVDVDFRVTNPDELARAVDAAVEHVANEIADAAEANTPIGSGPGQHGILRDGWQIQRNRDGQWRVANVVEYAPFVEFGNGNPGTAVGMFGAAIADARSKYG